MTSAEIYMYPLDELAELLHLAKPIGLAVISVCVTLLVAVGIRRNVIGGASSAGSLDSKAADLGGDRSHTDFCSCTRSEVSHCPARNSL